MHDRRIWCETSSHYLVAENIQPQSDPWWRTYKAAPSIVVILTDRIGDALNSIYFLHNLKTLCPSARITYIGPDLGDPAFLHRIIGQYVDQVRIIGQMSEKEFQGLQADVIFDLNPIPELFSYYPRSTARRIGHNRRCDVVVRQPPRNWKANDHLNLLRYFGEAIEFRYTPIQLPPRDDYRQQIRWPQRPYVALCLEATARAWMLCEHVMDELVRYLLQTTDLDICVVGSNINEHGYVFPSDSQRVHLLTSELSLFQAVCLLGQAEWAVTVDTGLMHAVSYLGVPLLALFTCGDPEKNGPQGQCGRVVVQRVRMDPPTGIWEKRDYKQSGDEKRYLRLDHIVEGIKKLHTTHETPIAQRIRESFEVAP